MPSTAPTEALTRASPGPTAVAIAPSTTPVTVTTVGSLDDHTGDASTSSRSCSSNTTARRCAVSPTSSTRSAGAISTESAAPTLELVGGSSQAASMTLTHARQPQQTGRLEYDRTHHG